MALAVHDAIQEAEDALDELDFFDLEKVCNRKAESSSSLVPKFMRLQLSVSSNNSNSSRKNLKNALMRLESVFDDAANFRVVTGHGLHTSLNVMKAHTRSTNEMRQREC